MLPFISSLILINRMNSVADLRGGGQAAPSPPLGRRTDAVTVLLTSENGSVLWRRHRQATATHQSLSLSSNMASKDDRKSQGWNTASSRPEGVNAENVNERVPLHFTYLHYVSTDADEWLSDQMMTTSHSSFSTAHGRLQPWLNSGR